MGAGTKKENCELRNLLTSVSVICTVLQRFLAKADNLSHHLLGYIHFGLQYYTEFSVVIAMGGMAEPVKRIVT